MSVSVTFEDWAEAWDTNCLPWQEDSVNKNLINNIEELTNGKPNVRILVPFCGKTLDMIWLVKQGHTVIAVEAIPKPIQDFFRENYIPFEKETVNMAPNGANVNVYTAFSGKLKIFNCDYFSFNSSVAGGNVDCIWDCEALCAILPERRKQYVKTSLSLLRPSPHGNILLHACAYETGEVLKGPPFSVTLEDLRTLYGDSFDFRLLNSEAQSEELRLLRCPLSSYMDLLVTIIKYKS